jgi:acetolactate synthase-1/2/3 large subunit
MGFALPAAVGAYFASPQSQIIAITGDGGFQMALQELQTMRHFNIPIKIIVLNNDILGLMKVFQDEIYNSVHCATVDGYSTPNISKIAHAFDFNFKRVSTTEEAISFIPKFLSIEESFILEVVIHKDWTCYPKNKRGYPVEYQEPSIPDDVFEKYMLIPVFKKALKKS